MIKIPLIIFNFLLYNFIAITLFGQLSEEGTPLSFSSSSKNIYQEIAITPPSLDKLWGKENFDDKMNLPHAFAKIIPLSLTPYNSGTWEYLPSGGRLWRLRLKAQNALATGLYFSNFYLPEGARLFIYSGQEEPVMGAFTNKNNSDSGLFATSLTRGDVVTIELDLPTASIESPRFTITGMDYAFRDIPEFRNGEFINSSGDCEVDINCVPEGDLWQEVKRGVVRIKVRVGSNSYWCTGSLINNTENDLTPYILTADHCAYKGMYATPQNLAQWIFYFNYEVNVCGGTEVSSDNFSMTGAETVAHGGEQGAVGSDFYLVRLMEDIPADEIDKVYFNGWSRFGDPADAGVSIHHPGGDYKKISTWDTPLESTSWLNNGLQTHWRVLWAETINGWGVTEGGSSGSPLFDMEGRILGTLTGGQASCSATTSPDYYGKFSWHWDSNGDADSSQLRPWLDPTNTGQYILRGYYFNDTSEIPILVEDIVIKPTLAKDVLNFEFINNPNPNFTVQITNYQGQIVRQSEVMQATNNEYKDYDISDLAVGFYILKVTLNGNSYIRKIVKR